MSDRLVKEL